MTITQVAKPPKGHIKSMRQDLLAYLEAASQQGDFLRIPVPLSKLFILNHPTLTQEVLVKQSRSFHKTFGVKYTANQIFGDNLFTSDGQLWKTLRGLIQPGFDVPRLQKYGQIMIQKTESTLQSLKNEDQLDMCEVAMDLTLRTTTQCFFGLDLQNTEIGQDLLDFIEVFFQRITSFPVPAWIPIPANVKLKHYYEKRREFFRELIAERRESGTDKIDMLSILLKAQDLDKTGILTDQQIANEISNLFAAGYEVTAYSLAFTLYLLATHPEIEDKVREELREVVGNRPLTVAALDQLTYLEQVIKEAMRLYPVTAVVGRQAIKDVEIEGDRIPKGSTVLVAPWILHRRADIFPDPLTFNPDRFEPGNELPKFAYLPFSGGPRACIGQGFAMMQIRINLAMMMQRYRFRLAPGYEFKPIFQFNTRPQNGLPMTVSEIERG